MKSLLRYRGLLVIVFYQALPIGTDQEGRTRIGFGVGGGTLEYATIGCDGEVIDAETAGYKTFGADLEHVSGRVRVNLAGGFQLADSSESQGPFAITTIAYERGGFGIGGGGGFIPGEYGGAVPSGYLRVGPAEQAHLRIEVFPPTVNTPTQAVRMVLGYNLFDLDRAGGEIGIAALESGDKAVFVGGVSLPVSSNVSLGLRGFLGQGYRHGQSGLSTEVRMKL